MSTERKPWTLQRIHDEIRDSTFVAVNPTLETLAAWADVFQAHLAREKAEPVAWQVRRIEIGDWSECTKEFHDKVVETGRYYGTGARAEARALYLHPTAPAEAESGAGSRSR